jgi:hypothetical protein
MIPPVIISHHPSGGAKIDMPIAPGYGGDIPKVGIADPVLQLISCRHRRHPEDEKEAQR